MKHLCSPGTWQWRPCLSRAGSCLSATQGRSGRHPSGPSRSSSERFVHTGSTESGARSHKCTKWNKKSTVGSGAATWPEVPGILAARQVVEAGRPVVGGRGVAGPLLRPQGGEGGFGHVQDRVQLWPAHHLPRHNPDIVWHPRALQGPRRGQL